ncbi:glycosyltransferase [Bacillus cereus]|uniref:glycosyltransferase n=1 Tax=Bacillus cereus TaxID=1396 RepID=UPI000BEB61D2|nr:glycosyltransferase [Bacillus cereus]MDA2166902.1 glycosyltransferase [Bacillus cereus]PEC80326.1 hypothetical protein CON08_08025 [Bacillus cereus]PET26278.1 hypothetical protein CN519_19415 [Bacillus cereus]PFI18194.1 hypothetical protein COI71_15285 [Bacillus cereus]
MKVLILGFLRSNDGVKSFGGAEKSMIMLANSFSEFGHDVHLVSLLGNHVAYPIDKGVKYHYFPDFKGNKILTHIKVMKNTLSVIKKYSPDVIISFWLHPVFYGYKFANSKGIKFIYSERNDPNLEYGSTLKKIRDFVFPKLDGFVFQSGGAKAYFSEDIQKKSKVIHNPLYISYDAYPFKEERDNRIVSIGRLSSQKNHALLINAFSKIAMEFPNYNLEIYGEGSLESSLRLLIKEKKLENRIKLMGTTERIMDEIYGAALFVLPSIYEGMPNALMEAMALGIPCISADCTPGGPRELIKHGENGLLFKVEDVEDLVNQMRLVLNNQVSATSIAKNAKNICLTNSADKVFKSWDDYMQMVAKQ